MRILMAGASRKGIDSVYLDSKEYLCPLNELKQKFISFTCDTSCDRTALMVAASNGDKDMVELLLKYQASLNLQSHVIDVCMECDFDTFIYEELQHLFNPKILDSGAT